MQTILRFINALGRSRIDHTLEIKQWTGRRAIYEGPGEYRYIDDEVKQFEVGDLLIETGQTIFLEQTISIPEQFNLAQTGLLFHTGARGFYTMQEGLVTINGLPYHGVDRNRNFVPFYSLDITNRQLHLAIELYNPIAQVQDQLNYQNEHAEYHPEPLTLLQAEIQQVNQAVNSLYYCMKTYYETAVLLPESDLNRIKIVKALKEVISQFYAGTWTDFKNEVKTRQVEQALLAQLEEVKGASQGFIHMVGQSHIDLAWLWPGKESVRKCSRTFSTMSTLLDQNEGFTYAQSQPRAYQYVKEYYPELYKRVKQHIADGRWELVGGMYVEPDLNIPSGESFVRQLLYGMKFFEDEFGKRPTIEWLPDTFGYCATLPQILKRSGVDYFMTTKMNWNDTNVFPYDMFRWVGIDGTSIVSYVCHGINEYTHPKEMKVHWNSHKQRELLPEQMLLYGHGDGGGGVTQEMIEYVKRSEELPGLPKAQFSTAESFFNKVAPIQSSLPTWHGDMYLELHRGTYTTHAKNKKFNRQSEQLYRDTEIWGTISQDITGINLNDTDTRVQEGYKLLLYNQFHDIIPGSSIPEVYVESDRDYKHIIAIGEESKSTYLRTLVSTMHLEGEGIPVIVFNSLSWSRDALIEIPLISHYAVSPYSVDGVLLTSEVTTKGGVPILVVQVKNIPALGWTTIWLKEDVAEAQVEKTVLAAYNSTWETVFYRLVWNENGEIVSLLDKVNNREIVATDQLMNQFQLFHDRPLCWDAWDIDPNFEEQPAGTAKLEHVEVVEAGKLKDVIQFNWTISNSSITQQIVLYHDNPRIDFETYVNWQEEHKLLKVAFHTDINSTRATYEIPYGAVERMTHTNTSWEQAQFEVCGYRWADLSEYGYGVALLNDSKYGYDIKHGRLRLSLLRAPKWPDKTADMGEHTFTYSLLPHLGDWRQGEVVKHAVELNTAVSTIVANQHNGQVKSTHSWSLVNSKHVVVEAIKQAEAGDGIIIRLYETAGGKEQVVLNVPSHLTAAYETNLMEDVEQNLTISDLHTLALTFKPYEIKTIKLIVK